MKQVLVEKAAQNQQARRDGERHPRWHGKAQGRLRDTPTRNAAMRLA